MPVAEGDSAIFQEGISSVPADRAPLRVGIVLTRNFTLSAFSLFVDTLRLASDDLDHSGRKYLDWDVVSDSMQLVQSSSGIQVAPTTRTTDRKPFDYLVVVGGRLNVEQPLNDALSTYLKKTAEKNTPVVGLCTGSFVLAEAGLLAGKTACVSWLHRNEFQQRFPDIGLVSHRLFLEDGAITTCAGGTAVADLAAWIVKKHVSAAAAKNAMEILQIERQRKGSDIQARLPLEVKDVNDHRVRLALMFMEESVHQKCDIGKFAGRVGLSSRQLERLFKQEINESPVRSFQRMRMAKAKVFVEETDQSILQIAMDFGYDSHAHFGKLFRAYFGKSPMETRNARPRGA